MIMDEFYNKLLSVYTPFVGLRSEQVSYGLSNKSLFALGRLYNIYALGLNHRFSASSFVSSYYFLKSVQDEFNLSDFVCYGSELL